MSAITMTLSSDTESEHDDSVVFEECTSRALIEAVATGSLLISALEAQTNALTKQAVNVSMSGGDSNVTHSHFLNNTVSGMLLITGTAHCSIFNDTFNLNGFEGDLLLLNGDGSLSVEAVAIKDNDREDGDSVISASAFSDVHFKQTVLQNNKVTSHLIAADSVELVTLHAIDILDSHAAQYLAFAGTGSGEFEMDGAEISGNAANNNSASRSVPVEALGFRNSFVANSFLMHNLGGEALFVANEVDEGVLSMTGISTLRMDDITIANNSARDGVPFEGHQL